MQINKVTRRWPVSHTCQTPTIWKLSLGYDFNQTGGNGTGDEFHILFLCENEGMAIWIFFLQNPAVIYLTWRAFLNWFFSTVQKKKSHLIRKIAALLYFCILRIPVYKVYLSLLLWSMFAFTIFCYFFIPPCLLTHYFVYLTSCYRFIYVLVCFPIKLKTWRTSLGHVSVDQDVDIVRPLFFIH